ncbi:hypothetical protein BDN71DRAFT_1435621 [Pleurotus eryngii]|uniref:Uncharacterized protein n=1 Tax=Pleurotus eryngii TaxID=5323 RepID=A0A9P5ZM59_PLEER|nr:hypothetical protein BDN71DRAFT_1435621 [Pleurotus eryngii]
MPAFAVPCSAFSLMPVSLFTGNPGPTYEPTHNHLDMTVWVLCRHRVSRLLKGQQFVLGGGSGRRAARKKGVGEAKMRGGECTTAGIDVGASKYEVLECWMPPGQLHLGRHIQLDDTTRGVRKEVPNTKERCIGYSKQVARKIVVYMCLPYSIGRPRSSLANSSFSFMFAVVRIYIMEVLHEMVVAFGSPRCTRGWSEAEMPRARDHMPLIIATPAVRTRDTDDITSGLLTLTLRKTKAITTKDTTAATKPSGTGSGTVDEEWVLQHGYKHRRVPEEGTHGHKRRRDPTTTDLGIKHEQGADHHGHVHERTMLTTYTKVILVATEQATTMTQTITLAPRRGECVSQVECNHNISARREDELEGRRKTVKMKDGEDNNKGNEGG